MGELILCNQQIAAMPYYIEGLSLNIYSLEELCYYIANNTFLLEKDFMNEELFGWIETEAGFPKLASGLRNIMNTDGLLSEYVYMILENVGYCTEEEIKDSLFIIKQMEEKTEFERNKIRADKLLENNKYLSSIYEYKRLLDREDTKHENGILVGNIWHNLGTAYARLFLFEEAIACYEMAYSFNEKQESLKECLYAYKCKGDEDGFIKKCKENYIGEKDMELIKNEISEAENSEEFQLFDENLKELSDYKNQDRSGYMRSISRIILDWKEDYRRVCKVS